VAAIDTLYYLGCADQTQNYSHLAVIIPAQFLVECI